MDRNTVTGLALIFLVMVAWAYFSMPSEQELKQRKEQARQDSIAAAQADTQQTPAQPQNTDTQDVTKSQEVPAQPPSEAAQPQQGQQQMGIFSSASISDTTETIVKTPLYRATFTNLGAGPSQITLRDYESWDHKPVHLIKDMSRSAYSMGFLTSENYNVETDQLLFKPLTNADSISIAKDDTTQLKYALNISDSKRVIYTYTLNGSSHEVDLDISFEGLERNIIGGAVDFGWTAPLNFTEKNPTTTEARYSSAYVYTGGEMEKLKVSEKNENEQDYNGSIDWVATRTKFFTQLIKTSNTTQGARLVAKQSGPTDDPSTDHHYKSFLKTDISQRGNVSFQLFAGPMAYHELNPYDGQAYGMVDTGYSWLSWLSDPIVEYIMIPYFDKAGNYMNIGIAIILFAILIKLILYPLTKKSYRSMAAMKELQPKMQEIKDKYEDDPEKQQKATMELYKEEGVNPLGGCLPNLLQLPILITLWRFFQNSIMIRQEEFLWATDLSAPDYIINLPFSVPFLGEQIAGFVLLMTAAMFMQSKLTGGMGPGGGGGGGAGPDMSALKYFFPFMLLFIFNNFAAGLSLYYLIYNVVSIIQQLIIYRQMDNEKEAAAA